MQITLNQDEILEALEGYVRSTINIRDDQVVTFDLKAGRGENGFTATLDIQPAAKANTSAVRQLTAPVAEVTAVAETVSVAEETTPEDAEMNQPEDPVAEETTAEPAAETPAPKKGGLFDFSEKKAS